MPRVANVTANVRVSRGRKICVKFENNVCTLYVALTKPKWRRLEGKDSILAGNFSVLLNTGGGKDFGEGSYPDCSKISLPA